MPTTFAESRPPLTSRSSTFPLFHETRRKPRRWPLVLRVSKGSIHLSILLPIIFHCAFTAIVVYFDLYVKSVGVPGTIVPSLSIVVGLMLVFRNGSSYDRFWTGRNNLAQITASVRNLIRYFLTCSRDGKDERSEAERVDTEAVVRVLIAMLYAVKHNLRSEYSTTSVTGPTTPLYFGTFTTPGTPTAAGRQRKQSLIDAEVLTESLTTIRPEYNELLPYTLSNLEDQGLGMPLQLAVNVEAYIRRGVLRGWWAPPQASYLDTQLANIISNYGSMETIRSTPLPVAHLIHVRQVLALYTLVLPFSMVDEWVWWTVPMIAVIAFTLYGIESIGAQLEDPFGYDKNDIKMDAIVEDARMEIDALLDEWRNPNSVLFA
jgi:ion channel-forming bestrophin family protein